MADPANQAIAPGGPAAPGDPARLEKHSVTIAGHRTSLSLERIFWDELKRIAEARGRSLNALIAEIDATRRGNLSSAVRVFVVQTLRGNGSGAAAAAESGQATATPSFSGGTGPARRG